MHSLLALATTALLALGAAAFPAKEQLNCRSSPSTSSGIVKTYSKGADIKISCQTTGTKVETSNVWDKTQDGCYVSDYYVQTGHSGIFTTRCGGGGSSCGPPPINDATVNLIKDFEGFVRTPKDDPGKLLAITFPLSPSLSPSLSLSISLQTVPNSPNKVGLPTVGYGHLCKRRGCAEVKYKFPLTPATAAMLLQDDVKTFANCVSNYLQDSVKLNDNQYGALVSSDLPRW